MDANKKPAEKATDLFGEPIKDLGPGEHQPGHNEDLGLSLSDDDWLAFDEAYEDRVQELAAAKPIPKPDA